MYNNDLLSVNKEMLLSIMFPLLLHCKFYQYPFIDCLEEKVTRCRMDQLIVVVILVTLYFLAFSYVTTGTVKWNCIDSF